MIYRVLIFDTFIYKGVKTQKNMFCGTRSLVLSLNLTKLFCRIAIFILFLRKFNKIRVTVVTFTKLQSTIYLDLNIVYIFKLLKTEIRQTSNH